MQLQKSNGFKQSSGGVIPEDWKLTRLEDIAEIKGRVGWKGYTRTDFAEKSHGAISLAVSNITKENRLTMEEVTYVSWKKYEESPEIHVSTGDIIITQRGSIGKIAIVDKELGRTTINPNILLIKKIKINNFFLYYMLISQSIEKQVSSFTSSTTIQLLTQQQIRSLMIPIPENAEQQKIASILSKVDELIQKMVQVIEPYFYLINISKIARK